jgi:phage shock protein A
MSLLDRTKKLLATSIKELEQRYTSPEAVLDRYVGELTNNLESAKAALLALRLEVDRLKNRVRELKADEKMWKGKAKAALVKRNDAELAREALRRKIRAAALYRELSKIIERHLKDIGIMEKSLIPLERKIADARSKRERLAARRASDAARREIKARLDDSGIGDFKEVEEQLLELEAQADTLNELKLLAVTDARPMPSADSDVENELDKLRKEIGRKD